MKKYICDVCSYIYDPEVGDPDGGITPGTAFENIPDDWECPECGVTKEDFNLFEEQVSTKEFLSIYKGSFRFLLTENNSLK